MKPAPFVHHAPRTVEEAVEVLGQVGHDGKVLAGGQSLIPILNMRLASPAHLVDINGVAGLDTIEEREDGLRIGALVRQQRLVDDDRVARAQPLLRAAAAHVGYPETRRRGTVGGSIAFGAPWAELTAAAVALDAVVELRSATGTREVRARDFFLGPRETARQDGELVVAARFPARAARSGGACHEVSARHRDYARVVAAAVVDVDAGGICTAATLTMLRVADRPLLLDCTEAVRDGGGVDGLLAGITPPDDVEASGAYRRRVAPVLAARALGEAMAEASA